MFSTIARSLPRLTAISRHSRLIHGWSRHSVPKHIHRHPHTRHFATPPPQLSTSTLSVAEYNQVSDDVMNSLVEDLETLVDEHGNPAFEIEYHSGVLTLKLGDEGTYVINKQPPNKQIWLSSPVSGPKRYDYSQEQDSWIYSRDQRSLGQLLNEELSKPFKQTIHLNIS